MSELDKVKPINKWPRDSGFYYPSEKESRLTEPMFWCAPCVHWCDDSEGCKYCPKHEQEEK